MTKSGRKRKKADKAKVQLKKGKKSLHLPKGQNVTDSRMTTKKITLVSQLTGPSASDGPLTKKKIGMKDLLFKLNSLSSSIRADGLEGLMELVKGEESVSILDEHLSLLLSCIAPMSTDRESKIRKLSNNIFSAIVKQVDVLRIEPLFPMLCAHLCCGLSHIDTYIQRDSLRHLDEILQLLPGLILKNFQQILPNCLNQISLQQNGGAGKPSLDKARTLSTNVDEKISSLHWRREVLRRVQKLFEIVIQAEDSSVRDSQGPVRKCFDPDNENQMGLYYEMPASNDKLSVVEVMAGYSQRSFDAQMKDDKSCLDRNYAKSLVPVLLDTWSEALLSSASGAKASKWGQNGPGNVQISSDLAPILEAVVKTLRLLIRHFKKASGDFDDASQMSVFTSDHEPRILKQMVDRFPFELLQKSAAKGRSGNKKSKENADNDDSADIAVAQINLCVIMLYADLRSGDLDEQIMSRFVDYLKELFVMLPTQHTVSQVSELLTTLCRSRIPATCSNKIDQLIESLARSHASNPKLVELLGLLAVRNGGQLPAVESWIEKLIDTLSSKAGTAKHREVVKVLLKQKNGTLLKVLPPNFDYFVLMSES